MERAIFALNDMDYGDFAEAEVITDNLASELRSALIPKKSDPFRTYTPTLFEVLEVLKNKYNLSDDAVESGYTLKKFLHDTYEFDDETIEFLRESAEYLVVELSSFLGQNYHVT